MYSKLSIKRHWSCSFKRPGLNFSKKSLLKDQVHFRKNRLYCFISGLHGQFLGSVKQPGLDIWKKTLLNNQYYLFIMFTSFIFRKRKWQNHYIHLPQNCKFGLFQQSPTNYGQFDLENWIYPIVEYWIVTKMSMFGRFTNINAMFAAAQKYCEVTNFGFVF